MANYTHEYSNFPFRIMELHNFKDVDDSIASTVNQIKILQSQGKYDKANEVIQSMKEVLGRYCFGSENINWLDEETRNLEMYAQSQKQSIYYCEEIPEYAIIFDVWIGGQEDITE